jgi:hypothetical protein
MPSETTNLCGLVLGAALGCLTVAAFSSVAAHGAEAPPAALAKARLAFASAVAAKDLPAVSAVTTFPLKVAATGQPPSVAQSAFPKFVQKNGYVENAACLRSGPLERADAHDHGANVWLVNCDGNVFYFALAKGAWRHSGYENINE